MNHDVKASHPAVSVREFIQGTDVPRNHTNLNDQPTGTFHLLCPYSSKVTSGALKYIDDIESRCSISKLPETILWMGQLHEYSG